MGKAARFLAISIALFMALLVILFGAANARATIFGTVRGTVEDPQHMLVQGATITLKAAHSDFMQTQMSDDHGQFIFTAVPLGDYTATVTLKGFQLQQQTVTVPSDQTVQVTFTLAIAGVQENVVVSAAPTETPSTSVTPTSTVNREDIQNTPGADRTDSVAAITEYTPGAYVVHDMLHIRGGHQFSWLIDGVPVPNTNIAQNVGPQIDPNDLDYIEVQRGSYDAEYGDRTYGVFNAVPRTGFEREDECELLLSYGSYQQTNDQVNCGSHTNNFAYYFSFDGNQTELGLQTPTAADDHDAANGYGGFSSLIYNATPHDQIRVIMSLRQDFFQIPDPPTGEISQPFTYSPETVVVTPMPGFFQDDTQREEDGLLSVSWVHTFADQGLLTVSPFYHFNGAYYDSSPLDFPNSVTSRRGSNYTGGQATLGATLAHNTMQGGFYGYWQRDDQLFGVLFTDGSNPPVSDREDINGGTVAEWFQDKYQPFNWLTLEAGLRETHFTSPNVVENATNPRFGGAIRVPRLNWVFDAFWGQFYQSPPLTTISGPLLGFVNTPGSPETPQEFTPLQGERDIELQAGVTIPYRNWTLHIDTFRTDSSNFLDHGNINYTYMGSVVPTNLFVPLTTQHALIRAWELTLKSPMIWHRVQGHLSYSNQIALFSGTVTGGINNFLSIANLCGTPTCWFPLDHDQRNTLNFGGTVLLPWHMTAGANFYYGSGFQNGAFVLGLTPPAPLYLSPNHSLDLTASKSFKEDRITITVDALNVTNDHLLIDDSLTFGGFHYNYPFEIYGEVRYRFHY